MWLKKLAIFKYVIKTTETINKVIMLHNIVIKKIAPTKGKQCSWKFIPGANIAPQWKSSFLTLAEIERQREREKFEYDQGVWSYDHSFGAVLGFN